MIVITTAASKNFPYAVPEPEKGQHRARQGAFYPRFHTPMLKEVLELVNTTTFTIYNNFALKFKIASFQLLQFCLALQNPYFVAGA
jgi:hypothetical protein